MLWGLVLERPSRFLAHRCGNAVDNETRERRHPTDMTDAQWAGVRPLLPAPGRLHGRGGRQEAVCQRATLDVVHYLADNGTKWRAIPADFPPWNRVYAFFCRWQGHGLVAEFHDGLRRKARAKADRGGEHADAPGSVSARPRTDPLRRRDVAHPLVGVPFHRQTGRGHRRSDGCASQKSVSCGAGVVAAATDGALRKRPGCALRLPRHAHADSPPAGAVGSADPRSWQVVADALKVCRRLPASMEPAVVLGAVVAEESPRCGVPAQW